MATVLWGAKGVVLLLLDILPKGQCTNAAEYYITLDASKMQCVSKDLDSWEWVLCISSILQPLIRQTLHSNGCSASVGKFFLILPTVQTLHPLIFICCDH
ncbi:hypothetical protein ElyMa_003683200 [Elysia marginata]|uniref:Secreted protein n=1 Tax=Elysia marginata TaxID=1093978 RepID=A0AAV4F122_9GAST|nr:hypothetical protein ElyMa_003683200 [Elysia marginata]